MRRCAAVLLALLLLSGLAVPASAALTHEEAIDFFCAVLIDAVREHRPEADLSGMGFSPNLLAEAQARLRDDPELFCVTGFTARTGG